MPVSRTAQREEDEDPGDHDPVELPHGGGGAPAAGHAVAAAEERGSDGPQQDHVQQERRDAQGNAHEAEVEARAREAAGGALGFEEVEVEEREPAADGALPGKRLVSTREQGEEA